jgi:hypothetical protein
MCFGSPRVVVGCCETNSPSAAAEAAWQDLLVLSACETGLVGSLGGDELAGLAQAFFHAGARSLVVSLWQVNDLATASLMSGFYSARKLGLDKASALTQAMSQVRAQQKWSHPFYWDAFVMMGDWNRISQLGKTPWVQHTGGGCFRCVYDFLYIAPSAHREPSFPRAKIIPEVVEDALDGKFGIPRVFFAVRQGDVSAPLFDGLKELLDDVASASLDANPSRERCEMQSPVHVHVSRVGLADGVHGMIKGAQNRIFERFGVERFRAEHGGVVVDTP